MSLVFTKDFWQNGSNRFGAIENHDDWAWLGNFLMDDGGCGTLHLLQMSERLRHEIQAHALSGKKVEQYREHFGVLIHGDKAEIDSLLHNEIIATMPTAVFLAKLEACIRFIKLNYIEEITNR